MEFRRLMRRIAGAGAALAAVGTMLIAPASATAAPDEVSAASGWVTIRHASSRLCLTAAKEGGAFLLGCDGRSDQRWLHFTDGDGVDRFLNDAANACLASNGETVFLMKDCYTPSGGWRIPGTSPKYVRHAVETTKCLHTNSGGPNKWGFVINCDEATRWSFIPA
ncbi:ricin-type beta-trefoil lectin domain protein [Lentzea sp. NPDC051838]|uniref:RICIN domain-containing protein n=1 Tax=Lentzea sp. NPDC051838 TaxID=3154849 RepID=UPI00341A430D